MTTANFETMTYDELADILRTSDDADARVAAHARMKELREAGKDYHAVEIEAAQEYIAASRRYTFGLCELTLDEAIQAYSSNRGGNGRAIFEAYKEMFISAVVAGWSARDDWGETEIRQFLNKDDGCVITEDYACYNELRDMALAGFEKAYEVYKAMDDEAVAKLNAADFDICVDAYENGVSAEHAFAL